MVATLNDGVDGWTSGLDGIPAPFVWQHNRRGSVTTCAYIAPAYVNSSLSYEQFYAITVHRYGSSRVNGPIDTQPDADAADSEWTATIAADILTCQPLPRQAMTALAPARRLKRSSNTRRHGLSLHHHFLLHDTLSRCGLLEVTHDPACCVLHMTTGL